jgi:hypothetical protein
VLLLFRLRSRSSDDLPALRRPGAAVRPRASLHEDRRRHSWRVRSVDDADGVLRVPRWSLRRRRTASSKRATRGYRITYDRAIRYDATALTRFTA